MGADMHDYKVCMDLLPPRRGSGIVHHSMGDQHIMVLNTCPDMASAEEIAGTLVDQGLAACVNIIPKLRSVYRWQGRREQSDELLLLIKTRTEHYAALEQAIVKLHPYELPEVLAVGINRALPGYLAWIDETVGSGT